MKLNIFNYIIFICIILFLFISIYYIIKKTQYKDLGTYYFKIIDKNGVESIIHDSGIKSLEEIKEITCLKTEYHEGKALKLDKPVEIYIGVNYNQLNKKDIISIDDTDLTYKIILK